MGIYDFENRKLTVRGIVRCFNVPEAEVECFGAAPSARMIARKLFSAGAEGVLLKGDDKGEA